MKKRIRILSAVLTVIMILGMLPLSLFALDGPIPVGSNAQVAYEERTLDEIKNGLGKAGMKLVMYSDFSSAFTSVSGVTIKNDNSFFSFENGVLKRNKTGTAQDYIEVKSDNLTYGDTYISFDLKMGNAGRVTPGNLFSFVSYNPSVYNEHLYLDYDGKIKLGDDIVGSLSKDTYTRISVATDRLNGKVYFYINDVVVNPEGTAFTAPNNHIRLFDTKKNIEADELFIDNLVLGNKYLIGSGATTSEETVRIQSDFTGANVGDAVMPGGVLNLAAFGAFNTGLVTSLDESSVVYANDSGTKVIRFNQSDNTSVAKLVAESRSSNNFSVSFDIKLGETTVQNASLVSYKCTLLDETRYEFRLLQVEADGRVRTRKFSTNAWDGAAIGTLSRTQYHNIRVDIITRALGSNNEAICLYYFDNVLVYVDKSTNYRGATWATPGQMWIENISILNTSHSNLRGEQIKNFSAKFTGLYNTFTAPFVKHAYGFLKGADGVLRYYDGKGGYATEDFVLGNTKYIVDTNGAILDSYEVNKDMFTSTEIKAGDRSYMNVIETLSLNNFTSRLYMDFEDQVTGLLPRAEFSGTEEAGNVTNVQTTSMPSLKGGRVEYKNFKHALGISEENGNKAFYFGYAPNTAVASENNNYLDAILNIEETRGHDLLLSVDFKMGGKIIGETKDSLLFFINRDGAINATPTVWVSNVGGLYLDKNLSPNSLIGYLSDTEYTNITVHVKLQENKYYVYLNDLLVNPEGNTFLELNENGVHPVSGKTPEEFKLNQVRIYNTNGNDSADAHGGLHVDNVILATRPQRATHNTVEQNLFAGAFSTMTPGKGIAANERLAGAQGLTNVTLSACQDLPNGFFSYANDGNDTVLKLGKPSGASDTGSAYLSLVGLGGYIGKNYSFSIDIKMGSTSLGHGYYQLFNVIHRASSNTTVGNVILRANGKLEFGGQEIGFASAEKYTRVTLDIACNEDTVTLYFYVDGVLKHKATVATSPWGAAENFYISDVQFICAYSNHNALTNMKENELYIKNVSAKFTDGYNDSTNLSSPFRNYTAGLVKTAGITRFYNEDGTYKKQDFTLSGVNYLVGLNGNVLGRETDGIAMYYAKYFSSSFIYGTDKNVKIMEDLSASGFGDSTSYIKPSRAAYNTAVKIDGVDARYYVSYINPNTGDNSQDSYWDVDTPNQRNASNLVFDFDIMLDSYNFGGSYGAYGIVTAKGLDIDGNRATVANDTVLLAIDSNGWLESSGKKLVPLSKTEFTKISVAVRTPDSGTNNGSFDIYVNGILMVENLPFESGMYGLQGFRNFETKNQTIGMYVKNVSLYDKADKPMQFRTMVDGTAVLTNDQSKTPAKASDLKSGTVEENGISRYYDSLGLPVINGSVIIDGSEYETDENGKIACGELSHFGTSNKGICSSCGKKSDGVSSLYGNSLILGTDVRVVFYLDLDAEKIDGLSIEIGRETDFASGNTVKTPVSELKTLTTSGKKYYKAEFGVPGKDLSDIIKVRIVKADGTVGTEYTYSAKSYIDTIKNKETSIVYSAELKSLVRALDVYGNNASAVLDMLPDISVNVPDSEVDWNKVPDATGNRSDDENIRLHSFSLELKSNIRLRVYFRFNSESMAQLDVRVNDEEVSVTETSLQNVWCVEYAVAAANLNDIFTISITSGNSFLNFNISPLYYAKFMCEKAESEEQKNLMKAIYKYWNEAEIYVKYTNSEDNSIIGSEEEWSVLQGKTLYSFGDSLVQGYHSGNGVLDGLAEAYGMIYTKYAKGGATINMTNPNNNIVYKQIELASDVCPDFVVFNGLTNDVGQNRLNYPAGTITEGFNNTFDTSTFCGSFEATIKLLKEKYPNAKIIYVTPHKMPSRHLESFKQLVDLALEMCEKWGISVANVYYDGNIDTTNNDQKVTYSYDNYDEAEGNGNGTHLTGRAYNIFYAPIVGRVMAESIIDPES